MRGKPVSGAASITIKPPTGFSIDGDNKVKTEVKAEVKQLRKSTPEEKFIAQLTAYIQFLEEQLDFVRNILKEAQARNGCNGCGKK